MKFNRLRTGGMLLAALCMIDLAAPPAAADEPNWRAPWQETLARYLQSLEEADVAMEFKPIDLGKLDSLNPQIGHFMFVGGYPPMPMAMQGARMDAAAFLWDGGIWHADETATQEAFTSDGLETGQMVLPAYPPHVNNMAWAYATDEPWNPYHGDETLARRAAIVSMVDLLMQAQMYGKGGPGEAGWESAGPGNAHSGRTGFTLTFNAFTALHTAKVLPEDVREAWHEGLRWMCQMLDRLGPFGPENMQLSIPVGMYYTYLATGDQDLKAMAERTMNGLLDEHFDVAGYIRDGGVPDGSYNGISMHRLAEYYAISHDPRMLEVLKKVYALKRHQALPEPATNAKGETLTLSPSHFNARTKDGFANDQYRGREVMFALDVPDARPFLIEQWESDYTTEKLKADAAKANEREFGRFGKPLLWAGRVEKWDSVHNLPYVMYHQDPQKLQALIDAGEPGFAVKDDERFVRSFGDEFFVVRRPAYAALLYAGPTWPTDSGKTNSHGMLDGRGGYFMGFGGGSLSAVWTPDAGALIIGRMTALEAYDRQTVTLKNGDYLLPGWQDWLTNHVVGVTADRKIMTTSRKVNPDIAFDPEAGTLTFSGAMPLVSERQGRLGEGGLKYTRRYTFNDDGIEVELTLVSDIDRTFESLSEVLPVRVQAGITVSVAAGRGATQPLGDDTVDDAAALVVERNGAGLAVRFPEPVTVNPRGVELKSRMQETVFARAVHLELPTTLKAGEPVTLRYGIVPLGSATSAPAVPSP